MYCFHPISVREWIEVVDYKASKEANETVYKKIKSNSCHLVPCGKCVACLARRRNDWTYRLTKEKEYSDYAYFITLTYDQQNIPIKINDEVPYFVFNKKHVQDYMKRVRYFIGEVDRSIKISYYVVSEYGSKTHRPHYHAIICVKNDSFLVHKKQLDMIVRDTWNMGFVTVKAASDANIHYVTKYCVKDLDQLPQDCIDPVFILASKRPYIGSSHEQDLQKQVNLSLEPKVFNHGFPGAMPRIYRNKTGVSGLLVVKSDIDERLSLEQENMYIKAFMASHQNFDLTEFHDYVTKRLFAIEQAAIRRQLKRNEKL